MRSTSRLVETVSQPRAVQKPVENPPWVCGIPVEFGRRGRVPPRTRNDPTRIFFSSHHSVLHCRPDMSIENVLTPEGVWCRSCNAITSHTTRSVHSAEGIVRLRRCKNCSEHFRTLETFLSEKYGDIRADYPPIAPRTTGGFQHR